MSKPAVGPVDAASDRIADYEEDDHREAVELERKIGVADQNLGLANELGHRNDRGDGAVLDGDDEKRSQGRQLTYFVS